MRAKYGHIALNKISFPQAIIPPEEGMVECRSCPLWMNDKDQLNVHMLARHPQPKKRRVRSFLFHLAF